MRALFALLLAFALTARANPDHLEERINLARSAPPEIAADALLKIAAGAPRDDRKALIEEAFQLGSLASQAYPDIAIAGTPPDTRPIYRSHASRLGLDALTLRSRAVAAMLETDRDRARMMFQTIPPPPAAKPECKDSLVPDFDAYYQLATRIAQTAFTARERREQEDFAFLLNLVRSASSELAWAPLAQAVVAMQPASGQAELLVATLASRLEQISSGDRLFSHHAGAMRDALDALIAFSRGRGIGVQGLVQSFATYLRAHQRGERCSDSPEAAALLEWYNNELRGDAPPVEAVRPAGIGKPEVEAYFESAEALRFAAAARQLRFDGQGRVLTLAQRQSPEWKRAFTDFLKDFAGWTTSGEKNEITDFHQKAILLEALFELAPPGPERDKLASAAVRHLSNATIQRQIAGEWMWHARAFLQAARTAPEVRALLAAYRESGHIALYLIAVLEPEAN
ncbi:MAG: hypothetical protein K2X35_17070 [Bryobacteraceae bacterium]|nr:hypothetical protein [Bryobacteraceae bacterium]